MKQQILPKKMKQATKSIYRSTSRSKEKEKIKNQLQIPL